MVRTILVDLAERVKVAASASKLHACEVDFCDPYSCLEKEPFLCLKYRGALFLLLAVAKTKKASLVTLV